MRLFVDTATSGLWHHEHNAKEEDQPHMTRLAWSLEDDIDTLKHDSLLIKLPPGVKIEVGASLATGIYAHNLEQDGVEQYDAMGKFCEALILADEIIGFAMSYQRKVLERELRKPDHYGQDRMHEVNVGGIKHVGVASVWPTEVCVQRLLTPILGLGYTGNKLPSFNEASDIIVHGGRIQIGNLFNPRKIGLKRLEHIRFFYQRIRDAEQERRHA